MSGRSNGRLGRRAAVPGAILIALTLLLGGCGFAGLRDLPLPGAPAVGDRPITVRADFDNVLSLATDSTVRLDGVTVGRVEAITRNGWKARVTLLLRRDVDLPANAGARIGQTSLLGEKYVALIRPQLPMAARLHDGSLITAADTSRGREVEEVLGALSLLLNGGGLGQLHTIVAELDSALGDREAVRGFLAQLDSLVGTLDRNRRQVVGALTQLNRLGRQLAGERRRIGRAIDSISGAMRTLAAQRDQVTAMLRHLDRFSTVAGEVVASAGEDLAAGLRDLAPILDALARTGDDLPRVLETVLSFPFPDQVLTAVKGDYVNLDVLMDLSPLVLAGNALGDNERLSQLPQSVLDLVPLFGANRQGVRR